MVDNNGFNELDSNQMLSLQKIFLQYTHIEKPFKVLNLHQSLDSFKYGINMKLYNKTMLCDALLLLLMIHPLHKHHCTLQIT